MEQSKGSSIASCVINLSNTIIGAGMLGLPGAFGGTGFVTGILLIVAAAAFSAHGLLLLSISAQKVGLPSSFYSVAHAAVPKYTIMIDLAVALKCFGVATGYLITISDSMVNALDHIISSPQSSVERESFFAQIILSRRLWVVVALMLVLPFSFYQTLNELKRASSVALIFVFMLVGMIMAYANGLADPCAGYEEESCRGDIVPFTTVPLTLSKLPIFVFSFTCHQNIFPIVNEIELLSQTRINAVIIFSIGFSLILYSVVALEGYRTYGSFVLGDILVNYPENNHVTILRVCIAFMLALHYPLQLDPARRCMISLVNSWIQWYNMNQSSKEGVLSEDVSQTHNYDLEPDEQNGSTYSTFLHNNTTLKSDHLPDYDKNMFTIITVSFLCLSFILAMAVDDLGMILALVGASGSTLVSYILPGLIYLKINTESSKIRVMASVQLCVGICIIPLTLYFIVKEYLKS